MLVALAPLGANVIESGVKSNPSRSSLRPSMINLFPSSTLSTVILTTVEPSVDENVTTSSAAGAGDVLTPPRVIFVLPSPPIPAVPVLPTIASSAKYVNEFSHSTLAPLVIKIPVWLGVNIVTLSNNIAASILPVATLAPSTLAPRPASPASNPYGSSLALVPNLTLDPKFKTVMSLQYALL